MKKNILVILYFLSIILIFIFNAIEVVEWLNKSLFIDFDMNTENAKESFFNGASIVFIITAIVYALSGTILVSLLITDILFAGFIVANFYKVNERNEYLTFSELKTIIHPKETLSFISVSTTTAILMAVSLIVLIAIIQYLIRKAYRKMNFTINKTMRLGIFIVFGALLIVILLKPNLYNSKILKFEEIESHNFNPVKQAQTVGFIPSFINTIKPHYMDAPAGYEKSNMQDIHEKYSQASKNINKERNAPINESQTILYLSESMMDPTLVPDLLENETPIPTIEKIVDENVGGTMFSQFMGGGTANIEWSVLTSFSTELFDKPLVTTPYSDFYLDSKNHRTIMDLIKNKNVVIHPYTANLYKRKDIFDVIDVDEFLYLDHGIKHEDKLGNMIRVSDQALNKDIFRILDNKKNGLLHVLSMQNHAPYEEYIQVIDYEPEINEAVYPKENLDELFNYLQAIKASDNAIGELKDKIDDAKNDVNFIFYGDHFPRLFEGMEDEFGEAHIHETPWFLYMNNQRLSDDENYEGVSPIFFTPILLREGEYYVTPFYALMDQLLQNDILRIGKDFVVTDKGKIPDEDLPNELSEMVKDYRLIQYDALFGHDWLPDEFYADTNK